MSGICGVVNFDGAPIEAEMLKKMARAAAHRGPDGIRYRVRGNIGLAHLALNITPESVREQQPLASERDDLVLVADARVDNHQELIRTLSAKGYLPGEDPTDAEVILAAYRCWGTGCPERLIGDFAFAIWDGGERRLFAARDAMAMRALYYRVEPRRVLFGTEVKQLLAAPDVPSRIYEPAVGASLAGCFGPLGWCFYEGISQLPPAHALVADEGGCRVWRYWDADPEYRLEYASEEEYVEHFTEVFLEAVRCRLRSTKPVGLFLSGGVDSGSIASAAGWLMRRDGRGVLPPFRAYSWAFEELTECDERHISEGIARYYGFPVTDMPADELWPLKDYPAHGPDRDEPFIGEFQPLIERGLSAASSEGMGLMLSGDRGDLVIGGELVDHLGLLWAGLWRPLWDELLAHGRWPEMSLPRVMITELLKPLLLTLWPRGAEWALQGRRWLLGRSGPPYPDWVRPEFARRIGLEEIVKQNQDPQPAAGGHAWRTRYEQIFMFQHARGTVWSDRTWARFGVGFADPWSDRRLAEFVLATPQWRIQGAREAKRIARLAMRGVMPEKARQSLSKIYLSPLYYRGLKERARDTILELITGSRAVARGYLDEAAFREGYKSFLRGDPQRFSFWDTVALEMWLRRYWH